MVAETQDSKSPKKDKTPKTPKPNGSAEAEAKVVVPKSGQSGPPLELPPAKLNKKERVVTGLLLKLDGDSSMSLAELASDCFPDEKKSNSWVRNSLRRLVRGGYVAKVDRGTYQMTENGRKRLA